MCTAEGQAALRRVLLAFSVQNPHVGYCQSMNFLAAALLLALDRAEEKAFWVLVCLIDDGGAPFSMSETRLSNVDQKVETWDGELWGLLIPGRISAQTELCIETRCRQQPPSPGPCYTLIILQPLFLWCNWLPSLCAGILYQDTYARDLTGAHVEMRSLEVRRSRGCKPSSRAGQAC